MIGILLLLCSSAWSETSQPVIHWHYGPESIPLGDLGNTEIPRGLQFVGEQSDTVLELLGNTPSGHELGLVSPTGHSHWFAVFRYYPIGHVHLDPYQWDRTEWNSVLSQLQALSKVDSPETQISEWSLKPRLDRHKKRIEWGVFASQEGKATINYYLVQFLRIGALVVHVVSNHPEFKEAHQHVLRMIKSTQWQNGVKYSSFQPGDPVSSLTAVETLVGLQKAPQKRHKKNTLVDLTWNLSHPKRDRFKSISCEGLRSASGLISVDLSIKDSGA